VCIGRDYLLAHDVLFGEQCLAANRTVTVLHILDVNRRLARGVKTSWRVEIGTTDQSASGRFGLAAASSDYYEVKSVDVGVSKCNLCRKPRYMAAQRNEPQIHVDN
jgi:hypothetical protein